ncbi:protein-disulfide reductase DsbD family protein [Marilutibacter chinensis]|uniref:Thioredoxin family protein n=1 Tax=Marilutibacter chinensis TaxID=2912247 RepID=A0ABS9HX24_9GAMM|nr:protein-disulfide reductase DsbD [Lysobacter chinensis]MCF7223283.1 thioredoxin family protein [Lysobacter chinensis]
MTRLRNAPARQRASAVMLALLALLMPPLPVQAAVDEEELLPVDEAFVLSASASAADTITVQWKIADGYYLYRHRTSVQADPAFAQGELQLPKGHAYTDEFFGDVETYRDRLTAVLPGRAGAGTVGLKVKYQGCADVGICYPPQTRELVVRMSDAASRSAAAGVAAPTAAAGGSDPAPASGGLRLPGSSGASSAVEPTAHGGRLLAPAALPGGEARPLPPEQAFAVQAFADGGNRLRVRFDVAPGYYLYRDKTAFRLQADDGGRGLASGRPDWPPGAAHEDEYFGRTTVYFEPVEVALPVLRREAGATDARLTVELQGCQTDGICYPPMTRQLAVSLPAGRVDIAGGQEPATADGGVDAPEPEVATGADRMPGSDAISGVADSSADAAALHEDPATAGAGADSMTAGKDRAPATDSGQRPPLNLFSALLLALGGGLILNLMPCVLPVLSLKALSLAGNGESPQRARRHALWYTAGVLLSFAALGGLALALREAGLALGWGFQLQQPLVVAVLALLMFALGLSLSGVWHVGGRWTGVGHELTAKSGPLGDFFTGVLAVVVATPCTAPLMGAALAWAFTADTATAMAVFLALGLGLALPFLLIGFIPALAHRLPRPGAWMETFKQLLAFPLYLTAVWLAWVLARQRGADAIGWFLLAATALALAAWAWTRARRDGRRWAAIVAGLALLATAWPLLRIHQMPRPQATASVASATDAAAATVPFSERRLAELRAAGRPVFVNVTADWCVSCKANESTVFSRDEFRETLAATGTVYMVGDWTDVDPALTAFLQRHEAVGVPLYVVYPAGGGEGRVLPILLTPGVVREALLDAAGAAR